MRLPDIIRAPNHVGDLVMSLPAILAAESADVVVPRALAPILSLVQRSGATITFQRGQRGLMHAVRAIRVRRYERGAVLTRSFSSAAMFKLGGVKRVRGISTDGRRLLLHEALPESTIKGRSRPTAYYEIAIGVTPVDEPIPVISISAEQREEWWQHAPLPKQRFVAVFPGGNASSRRWDPARFAEVVASLATDLPVIVLGGPGEVDIGREVAGARGIDMSGRTTLPVLAAALAECDILITNDSGPLHLAAAVGTRTLSLWGAGDPVETGVRGAAHHLLRHPELPCVPCVKNECPRKGPGYVLPEAERECLQLIAVPDVVSAAQTMLAQ